MTTRNEEILKAAHELEYPENVPYFVNGAEWADKHPSKESLSPQNRWKPSDEQMQTLYRYAEQNNYDGAVLTSLYNDIKKLK